MLDLPPGLFVRPPAGNDYSAYARTLSSAMTWSRPLFVSRRRATRLFSVDRDEDYRSFRFAVLRDWLAQSDVDAPLFFFWLSRVLRNLVLDSELNDAERSFVASLRELAFARGRRLKDLAVDFARLADETVYYRYDGVRLTQLEAEGPFVLAGNADLYITSQRLVFADARNLFALPLDGLTVGAAASGDAALSLKGGGLRFALTGPDEATLAVSIERATSRWPRWTQR